MGGGREDGEEGGREREREERKKGRKALQLWYFCVLLKLLVLENGHYVHSAVPRRGQQL